MTQPFAHMDAPTLIGSWPMVQDIFTGTAGVLPNSLIWRARIIGVTRETASGYDVTGRTFDLNVDGTTYPIPFTGTAPLTLQEVIDQINAAVGFTVAYDDNKFLRLQSPTVGENSYLEITTDLASNPTDVMYNLGLFPGSKSRGGDIDSARHIDPDRQLAFPNQMSWLEGESFESRVFNRALLQLGVNTDRNYGLLERKRMGKITEMSFAGGADGFTINDTIFVGTNASPTQAQLENVVTVLDDEYNEVFFEDENHILYSFMAFYVDGPTGKQIVVNGTGTPFTQAQEEGDFYILSNSGALPASMQGVPMKIVESLGNYAVIQPIDPTTGDNVAISTSWTSASIVERVPTQVKAVGLWTDGTKTTAIGKTQFSKTTATITRLEQNNRVTCAGESFTSDGTAVGDIVELTGASSDEPFSNNGTYRVGRIIDNETLELVTEEYGPVILNYKGSPGSIEIKTDGDFYTNPYVELNIDPDSGSYRVLYKGLSTFKEIIDADPGALAGALHQVQQEADEQVQEALVRMWGPTATSFNDVLYNDKRYSLEDIYYRVDLEHYKHDEVVPGGGYSSGKHRSIRPDTINMWTNVDGPTIEIHDGSSDTTEPKVLLWNDGDTLTYFSVHADGRVVSYASGDANGPDAVGSTPYAELLPNGTVRASTMAGDSWIESIARGTSDTAVLRATGDGSSAKAVLQLYSNDDSDTLGLGFSSSGLGSSVINMRGDMAGPNNIWYSLSLRPDGNALKLDVIESSAGTVDNLMVWRADNGGRIGVNRNDPRYDLDISGSFGVVNDVYVNQHLMVNRTDKPSYNGLFPALNVHRRVGEYGIVIESDAAAGASLIFKQNDSPAVANQKYSEFDGSNGKTFRIHTLSDAMAHQFAIMAWDLGSGNTAIGDDTVYNHSFQQGCNLEVYQAMAVGDHSAYTGLGTQTGSIRGKALGFLDSAGATIFTQSDGNGVFARYTNAYYDGTNHRAAIEANSSTTVPSKTVWDGADIHWDVKDWKQGNLNKWDTIDWRRAKTIDAEANVITYEKLKSIGTQEYEGIGHDRISNDTRTGPSPITQLQSKTQSAMHLNSRFSPYGQWVLPASGYNHFYLDGKYLWGVRAPATGSITFFASNTSNDVMATDIGAFSLSLVGTPAELYFEIRTYGNAILLGDYLYILGSRYSVSNHRWALLKVNVKDRLNPYYVDYYEGPDYTSQTGISLGFITDGTSLFVTSPNTVGSGNVSVFKFAAYPTSDTALAFVNSLTIAGGGSHRNVNVFDGRYLVSVKASGGGVWVTSVDPRIGSPTLPMTSAHTSTILTGSVGGDVSTAIPLPYGITGFVYENASIDPVFVYLKDGNTGGFYQRTMTGDTGTFDADPENLYSNGSRVLFDRALVNPWGAVVETSNGLHGAGRNDSYFLFADASYRYSVLDPGFATVLRNPVLV